MHLPYTQTYPEAVAVASDCLAATLTAVVWARPLKRPVANGLFVAGIWVTALLANAPALEHLAGRGVLPSPEAWLALGATLTTLALFRAGPRWFGALAALGQSALLALVSWVEASNDELMFAHLVWYGALLGAHALRAAPPRSTARPAERLSYPVQDAAIFLAAVALALFVMHRVFEGVVYNGDEVANTFQAEVYGHFRAAAPVPPCPSMFQNYWVFRYHDHLFSQYTPGWPLFMAPFARLGVTWLAGPTMAGLVAVAVARLTRRAASGLGATLEDSARIVGVAGPLGAACALFGPSLLLNGASRFSHTMVAGCFAWAVESAAAIATPGLSRRRSLAYGLLLGVATSLGLATRPADGGFLGVGVFVYFVRLLWQRRVTLPAFLGTCAGFLCFGGLTVVILRLQLGAWFQTGYAITPLFHPEGKLSLSLPHPAELKYGVPLATGSYCWWPAAPALGVLGLVRALGGRERRVAAMLGLSSLCLVGFYCLVEFGRGGDDGLGPRYILPVVVAQAAGTGAALAPALARLGACLGALDLAAFRRFGVYGPALLMLASAGYGVGRLAPMTYPVAYEENHAATAPLRAARAAGIHRAIVLLIPGHLPAHQTNLAQNPAMDPDPDVLFLIRNGPSDDRCAARHFPGRTWYRASTTDKLTPY